MATIAELRGWAPIVALQVEYSLIRRTVEGNLFGAAAELGLGVLERRSSTRTIAGLRSIIAR